MIGEQNSINVEDHENWRLPNLIVRGNDELKKKKKKI